VKEQYIKCNRLNKQNCLVFSGEQSGAVEVPPVSDVYDSGYYGIDDAERG